MRHNFLKQKNVFLSESILSELLLFYYRRYFLLVEVFLRTK